MNLLSTIYVNPKPKNEETSFQIQKIRTLVKNYFVHFLNEWRINVYKNTSKGECLHYKCFKKLLFLHSSTCVCALFVPDPGRFKRPICLFEVIETFYFGISAGLLDQNEKTALYSNRKLYFALHVRTKSRNKDKSSSLEWF